MEHVSLHTLINQNLRNPWSGVFISFYFCNSYLLCSVLQISTDQGKSLFQVSFGLRHKNKQTFNVGNDLNSFWTGQVTQKRQKLERRSSCCLTFIANHLFMDKNASYTPCTIEEQRSNNFLLFAERITGDVKCHQMSQGFFIRPRLRSASWYHWSLMCSNGQWPYYRILNHWYSY